MSGKTPMAFFSYVRFDDQADEGRLSQIRARLAAEIQVQTGSRFEIFQDRNDIQWGENWKTRIEESLDNAVLLIPVLTPSFFRSEFCRQELRRFLDREKTMRSHNLIFPIYYVSCPSLENTDSLPGDELAAVLGKRQFADWRDLRFEPATSPTVSRAIEKMAIQIRDRVCCDAGANEAVVTRRQSMLDAIDDAPPTESEKSIAFSRREPNVHLVQAGFEGAFPTIAEAVRAAAAGDRILVRPGIYEECLLLEKPLEIVGDVDRGAVVIQSNSGRSVILFRTTFGRISNVTIRQLDEINGAGVDIGQGRLELDSCDISSRSLPCVIVHSAADPMIRRSRIHAGAQSGVFVYDDGRGTFEDNDIFGHSLNGVEVQSGGNPVFRGNSIHDCKHSGVYVYDGGNGTFEDNDIFKNSTNGCVMRSSGNPIVRRNRIYGCAHSGIYAFQNALGIIESNYILDNANGVVVESKSNPQLRGNHIMNNRNSGVHVYNAAAGRIEDNKIRANSWNGVEVGTDSTPMLRGNDIDENGHAGVYVHAGAVVILERNSIVKNFKSGIAVIDRAVADLRSNIVGENQQYGVYLDTSGRVVDEDSTVRDNVLGNWYVNPGSGATLTRTGDKGRKAT